MRKLTNILFAVAVCAAAPFSTSGVSFADELQGKLLGRSMSGAHYPLPHTSLTFCTASGHCQETFTNADGNYLVNVRPGDYTIFAPSRDGSTISKDVSINRRMGRLDILAD
jgi:hypothetical protein